MNLGDITKIKVEDIPEHDLFTYSFPCQDLSVAGKQAGLGKGTRSGLLYECEKIIEAKKPKYLLLENVKNLVGKKFKPEFDKWLDYLESLGYTNYWKVLNAKDYGVPQNRERVFVFSIRKDIDDGTFKFPIPFESNKKLIDLMEDEKDIQGDYEVHKTWTPRVLEDLNKGIGDREEIINKVIKEYNRSIKHQQDALQSAYDICRCIPAGTHGSTPHLLKTVLWCEDE